MESQLKDLSSLDIAAISSAFAGAGGSLAYWLKVEEGREFVWHEFILHTLVSAFFGLVTYELLHYSGLPDGVCGALSGVSGWMGTRMARIAEILVCRRAGIKKEDLE